MMGKFEKIKKIAKDNLLVGAMMVSSVAGFSKEAPKADTVNPVNTETIAKDYTLDLEEDISMFDDSIQKLEKQQISLQQQLESAELHYSVEANKVITTIKNVLENKDRETKKNLGETVEYPAAVEALGTFLTQHAMPVKDIEKNPELSKEFHKITVNIYNLEAKLGLVSNFQIGSVQSSADVDEHTDLGGTPKRLKTIQISIRDIKLNIQKTKELLASAQTQEDQLTAKLQQIKTNNAATAEVGE